MSSDELLRKSEETALSNNQFISSVGGKTTKSGSFKKAASFSAVGFLIAMILIIVVLFSAGNIIPSAISERLIEETDVQYADAVESKKIVFQQALLNGDIPDDTASILEANGVSVGYYDGGEFKKTNKHSGGLTLLVGDRVVTAENFISEVSSNIKLYEAFNNATYSRAAYYYDEAAQKVFREIGTTRNNYIDDSDFDEVMDNLVGNGSDININNVDLVEKKIINKQTGKEETILEYEEIGGKTNSSSDSSEFIASVAQKNRAGDMNTATLNSADSIKVADTISKEQRSSLFYLTFMENISKMKAGEGNNSKINEAMNYLYESRESEVIDVKTGEVIKISGTPLESPSLYAILSGNKINVEDVSNYSSDRVLKTVQNRLNTNDASSIPGTITSTNNRVRGSIGRFLNFGVAESSIDVLNTVNLTVDNSLVNNSYSTIEGINAGEFLVEGAINVGRKLAKASGATAGNADAVLAYQKLNNSVLAMDRQIDRNNRSPLDITSKNTFLGSIFYKFANILANSKGLVGGLTSINSTVSNSIIGLLPSSYADTIDGYLTNFGDCETIGQIGAVGSAQCTEIATFDPTTLNDPFNNSSFIEFINQNTSLNESGVRTVNEGSLLADFIIYNNERKTPIGIMDGGILDSLVNKSGSIPFLTNILDMIKIFLGSSEDDKRIASGAAFVNSSSNTDWQTYKYAQRYVSLARATSTLRQYAGNSTAYNNIKFFEGDSNPIAVFLDNYYAKNSY